MSTFDDSPRAHGDPDLRGWEIRTVSGRRLGKVADVLIDRGPDDAIMIDVDLPGRDRHAVFPIRRTQIDRETRVIFMDSGELSADDATPPTQRREAGGERRRTERRRIERMGTDL